MNWIYGMRWWVVVLLLVQAAPVLAWNRAGHMVTGAIAYGTLEERSPETLQAVVDLLRSHPHFESLWRSELQRGFVPSGERDLYLFMLAARWADDIRGEEDFDHPSWHYVNLPLRAEGDPTPLREPNPENVLVALQENRDRVSSRRDRSERSVALGWLFHLVGDLHQPLHAVQLFSERYPRGDRGGTLFEVQASRGRGTIHLHRFWDGLIQGSQRFRSVRNRATELRRRGGLGWQDLEGEIQVESFEDWAEESRTLAWELAYRQGRLQEEVDQNRGRLPESYGRDVQGAAEERAVLAAYRLAALLERLFSQPAT